MKNYFSTTFTLKRFYYLIPILLIAATTTRTIIIRDDVPDSKYVVPENAFPALIDLPDEGHGVLISEQWVVTVAHTVSSTPKKVTVGGQARAVAELFIYPGFPASAAEFRKFFKQMKSADSVSSSTLLAEYASIRESMHDIALMKLAKPIEDIKPVALYEDSDELGKIAKIYGKGTTGNGAVGEYPHSPRRGKLRRAFNRISKVQNQWLVYKFDCGEEALPLEGVIGHGDSGSPLLIKKDGKWKLAGLAHGLYPQESDITKVRSGEFQYGVYGQKFMYSRISYYLDWISSVMTSH